MHWPTSAITLWVRLHVPIIAHEPEHCFGLEHRTLVEDPNFDSSDILNWTADLMSGDWDPGHPNRFK